MRYRELAVNRETLEQRSGIRTCHIPSLNRRCPCIPRRVLRSVGRSPRWVARFSSWNPSAPLRPPRTSNLGMDWLDDGDNATPSSPRARDIITDGRLE